MNRFLHFAFLVVLAVLTPQVAYATCGDWLAHHDANEVIDATGTGHFLWNIHESSSEKTVPPRCSGPLCKQSPLNSSPEPISPTTERFHHETAWISYPSQLSGSLSWNHLSDAQTMLGQGEIVPIDRPPRR